MSNGGDRIQLQSCEEVQVGQSWQGSENEYLCCIEQKMCLEQTLDSWWCALYSRASMTHEFIQPCLCTQRAYELEGSLEKLEEEVRAEQRIVEALEKENSNLEVSLEARNLLGLEKSCQF